MTDPEYPERLSRLLRLCRDERPSPGLREFIRYVVHESNSEINHVQAREWAEQNGSCYHWGEKEWRRAAGDTICIACGKTAWEHPQECGPSYGLCSDPVLFLHRLCDGGLVKL